jgi:hypothetical protein
VGEVKERGKFVRKEGVSEGEVTNGLTKDMETGGTFSSGGEECECMEEFSGIRGREVGEREGACCGREEFGFGEVEGDAMGLA